MNLDGTEMNRDGIDIGRGQHAAAIMTELGIADQTD